jgi:CheY-like chemotaxis protein
LIAQEPGPILEAMSALRAVPPPGARVLVIDDDRDLCEALCEVLSDAGYQVSSAANGFEGLRALAAADRLPDLVIIDLHMPVMDGYEFRRAVALEQCWNRLLATARCDLHCGYAAPTSPSQEAAVDWIRLQHSDSIAA